MVYDVIVIGKGPAGISGAIYSTRANLKTLVLGKLDSMLLKADKIENYYGFENPIGGRELLETGLKQAERLGAEIVEEEVVNIEKTENFNIITVDGQYEAKTVLLATGAPVVRVPIKNLDKYEGAGVSYCTTCDGFFYRNKKVGVLGYNDFAIHEAADLLNFTQDITLFTNEMELNVSDNAKPVIEKLKVNNKKIKELGKGDILEEIVFDDGTAEDIEGLFIAFGSASSTSFALKMGIVTDGKSIIVNEKMETNIPGLYAAGDCTGVFKQVAVAVGQGAIAAREMAAYIRKK
ncbi:MAG: NAD(P)/FAD-dependent oxidoreductase [Acetivibrionales bacterium]|jgi:thioredoxin reductase (NADPH)|nr:NAD(P)/FAD-dependent oxidoreductase [Clostridiaceae bacterium]